MDNKPRCQSCGMPLGDGYYGLNANGTINTKFCKYCFENGDFHEPNLTMEEMIGRSIANMIDDLHMNQEEAEKLANQTIPTLERWNKN